MLTDADMVKACARCGRIKPLDQFHKNRTQKLGLFSYCKSCKSTVDKAWRTAHSEAKKKTDKAYRVRNPVKIAKQKAEWAHVNRPRLNAMATVRRRSNPDAASARQARYVAKNPEKVKAANRKWVSENVQRKRQLDAMYRARKRGATVENVSAWANRMRAKKRVRCFYCGHSMAGTHCQFDHIVAVSKGGAHAQFNLVVSCPPCNRRKSAKHVNEFIREGQLILC